MCILSIFSRKQPSTNRKSLPKDLLVVEDTVKLALKPWKDFVTVNESSSIMVDAPIANIVTKEIIPDMASALRVANVILQTVKNEVDPSVLYPGISWTMTRTDNGMFFHQSSVSLIASTLYYFVHKFPSDGYGEEDQVDLPHVLAFLQLDIGTILEVLETCPSVYFSMLPYHISYKNKTIDMLEIMLAETYVNLAPLATRENMWLLGCTNNEGHTLLQPTTDVSYTLDKTYEKVQQDVRDYVDFLLGIREKPIEIANIDDELISTDIPDDIEVVDEPYAKEAEEDMDPLGPYARMMQKRFGYYIDDLDSDNL